MWGWPRGCGKGIVYVCGLAQQQHAAGASRGGAHGWWATGSTAALGWDWVGGGARLKLADARLGDAHGEHMPVS